jgi:hypothetical protein
MTGGALVRGDYTWLVAAGFEDGIGTSWSSCPDGRAVFVSSLPDGRAVFVSSLLAARSVLTFTQSPAASRQADEASSPRGHAHPGSVTGCVGERGRGRGRQQARWGNCGRQ